MKKKTLLIALCLLAAVGMIKADDPDPNLIAIIHPATGSGTADITVNGFYENATHVFINKDKFTSAVPGNEIHINGHSVTPGAYLYIGGYSETDPATPYPGTHKVNVSELPVSIFLTKDMIEAIKTDHCRIYGQNMTINCVTLFKGKQGALKFGKTIWTQNPAVAHSHKMDDWTTLELYKEAFDGISLADFKAIRFYHNADRTENLNLYVIVDDWKEENRIGTEETMTMTNEYAELKLTSAIIEKLGSMTKQLNIQGNKGSGAAFYLTDIVLIPNDPCDNCFYYNYYE